MKRITVLTLLLAIVTQTFAQGLLTKQSPRITEATGYYLNGSRYNINKNMISSNADKKKKIETPSENFYWLQSGVFSQVGKTYHIFYYEALNGEYKYPNIQEDWQTFHQVNYFALNDSEYAQLKSVVLKKEGKQECISTSVDEQTIRITKFDESEFIGRVSTYWGLNSDPSQCFLVKSLNVGGKDVVQFRFGATKRDNPNLLSSYFEVSLDDFKKLFVD